MFGCKGTFAALTVARLAERLPKEARPLVVVAPDEASALAWVRDLRFFLPEARAQATVEELAHGDAPDPLAAPRVLHLPEVETSPWADISPDRRAILQRMAVLFRLSQGLTGEVLVASASALARRVIPRAAYSDLIDVIQSGESIDRDNTVALLQRGGFTRAPVVEDPGTFAVRGGVIDVFAPLYRFPLRIELYGDLVESIRFFDPVTQRTMRAVPEVYLHPVRETVLTRGHALKERLLEAGDHAHHPSSKTRALLDQIEKGEDFFGVEALTPAFHAQLVSLGDYLPLQPHLFSTIRTQ